MNPESGKTASVWAETGSVPDFPPLKFDPTVDVCIVGGGMAGLNVAYQLTKAGKKVVVIDDGSICGGETARTTAHLSIVQDHTYHAIESEHSTEVARLAYISHKTAIETIEQIIKAESIECDFERLDAYLFEGTEVNDELDKEFAAIERIGIAGVEMLEAMPGAGKLANRRCIKYANQAKFHVLKYLKALSEAIVRDGGQIFSGTHADKITDGKPVKVKTTAGFTITSDYLVVATNSPVSDLAKIHTKQAPYRSYVIAGKVPINEVPNALMYDTEDPYHYVRTTPIEGDNERVWLIIGGEDHKTGQDDLAHHHFRNLETWAKEYFPALEIAECQWSGQVMETVDGMAFIGRDPAHEDNVFIATGDCGMGMTHGTIAGILISDLIMGVENPWKAVFEPSRIPLKTAADFISENMNVALQYADYVKSGDVESIDDIKVGCGAVIHQGGKAIAAYRDQSGAIVQCSAVCPHLLALVRWNDVEKTWDCPAHGSRFMSNGEVVNGPANSDLPTIPSAPVSDSDEKQPARTIFIAPPAAQA